jgi:hypothetical protein
VRFEVLTAVKMTILFFLVLMLYWLIGRYILPPVSVLKMETLKYYVPSKRWCLLMSPHGFTSQKNIVVLFNFFIKIVLRLLLLTYNFVCRNSGILCKFLIHCLGWTLSSEPHFAAAPSLLPVYLQHRMVLENRLKEFLTYFPELLPLVIYWWVVVLLVCYISSE